MKAPVLLALALSTLLTSCVVTPVVVDPAYPPGPSGPHHPHPGGYVDTPGDAHRLGESLGRDDRRDGRSHYAGRYRGRVPSHLWNSFSSGYEQGFHSTAGGGGGHWNGGGHGNNHDHDNFNSAVYQNGQRAGREDRLRGLSPNHRRHTGEFPMRYEESFRRGYQAGWH